MPQLIEGFARYISGAPKALRPRTREVYLRILTEFSEFASRLYGVDKPNLESLDAGDITRFLQEGPAEGRPRSTSTWNLRRSALSTFYDFLYRQGHVTRNPAKQIDRVRVERTDKKPLSFREMMALHDAALSSPEGLQRRNAAIVLVLMHNGLRVSELASLNLDQIDLEEHIFYDVDTKGGKRSSVYFNDLVCQALEAYVVERSTLDAGEGNSALFLSKQRRRLSVRAVQEMVAKCGRVAGIRRKVTPHLLRHSSGTAVAAETGDVYAVKAQLRHADIRTSDHYVHLGSGKQRAAVTALERTWRHHEAERNQAGSST